MTFLTDIQLRPLASGGMPGSKTLGFALGQGQAPLEVVVMESATQPAITAMRTAWKDRHGGRAAPVLLVAIYGNRAANGCQTSHVFLMHSLRQTRKTYRA